METNIYEVFGM